MKINFYANGNTLNHGCEAIYLSLSEIFKDYDLCAYTEFYKNDEKIIKNNITFKDIYKYKNDFFQTLFFKIRYKILKNDKIYFDYKYRPFYKKICPKNEICLSVGGDNYCYNYNFWLDSINNYLIKNNNKLILTGCSIDATSLTEEAVNELNSFSHIIARESITYNNLLNKGLNKVSLIPDPAFILDTDKIVDDDKFFENDVIGINISPLIINQSIDKTLFLKNINELIDFILSNSDNNIMLIPHVIIDGNNDYEVLKKIYNSYSYTNRIKLIYSESATQLKGYISKCKILIASRTHASIAAYSNCIPTLVIGYSVKSQGIAKDLFGTSKNYVIPVNDIHNERDLLKAYIYICENYKDIKYKLQTIMPEYKARCYNIKKVVEEITNEQN